MGGARVASTSAKLFPTFIFPWRAFAVFDGADVKVRTGFTRRTVLRRAVVADALGAGEIVTIRTDVGIGNLPEHIVAVSVALAAVLSLVHEVAASRFRTAKC